MDSVITYFEIIFNICLRLKNHIHNFDLNEFKTGLSMLCILWKCKLNCEPKCTKLIGNQLKNSAEAGNQFKKLDLHKVNQNCKLNS